MTVDTAGTSHVDTFVIDGLPAPDAWPDIIIPPELDYGERLNAATVLLDDHLVAGNGDRRCVQDQHNTWTYAELAAWSNRIANVLVDDYGIVPGNRVVLRGVNSSWMVAAWFAVVKVGAVAVATMPMLREPELTKVYRKCSPSLGLSDPDLADALRNVAEAPAASESFGPTPVAVWGSDGDLIERAKQASDTFDTVDTYGSDPVLLGFTSGTTGEPKATIHFHRDLIAIADSFLRTLDADADDVFIGSPPLAFTFGLGGLVIFPMRLGASTVYPAVANPEGLAREIESSGATVCFTAPTAYRAILQLDPRPDLSTLRRGVSAGETLPLATFEAFETQTSVRLIDGIGATEMLHIFISDSGDDIRPGSTGRPTFGFEAKIVDDDGTEVPDGTAGRLAVRGPVGCRYLDDERQAKYVSNGWNLTGDSFIRDADGHYWYQARTDDMIVSSGYNIAGPEVEETLITHPAVAEVGVIGTPDAERGSLVTAAVRVADGWVGSDELRVELQNFVKQTIAPYKYPRRIVFVDQPLPTTATGKLMRRGIHDLMD